jgi:beta-catenin-like protein 1
MPDAPTPEMLKKMKFDSSAEIPAVQMPPTEKEKGKQRAVTVEEVDDEDRPSTDFAPGGDADYFMEEDEEGRFFGGGLTSEQKEILNIFDNAGEDALRDDVSVEFVSSILLCLSVIQSDEWSITGIRRKLLRFERAANKNQEQRSKYPNDPTK